MSAAGAPKVPNPARVAALRAANRPVPDASGQTMRAKQLADDLELLIQLHGLANGARNVRVLLGKPGNTGRDEATKELAQLDVLAADAMQHNEPGSRQKAAQARIDLQAYGHSHIHKAHAAATEGSEAVKRELAAMNLRLPKKDAAPSEAASAWLMLPPGKNDTIRVLAHRPAAKEGVLDPFASLDAAYPHAVTSHPALGEFVGVELDTAPLGIRAIESTEQAHARDPDRMQAGAHAPPAQSIHDAVSASLAKHLPGQAMEAYRAQVSASIARELHGERKRAKIGTGSVWKYDAEADEARVARITAVLAANRAYLTAAPLKPESRRIAASETYLEALKRPHLLQENLALPAIWEATHVPPRTPLSALPPELLGDEGGKAADGSDDILPVPISPMTVYHPSDPMIRQLPQVLPAPRAVAAMVSGIVGASRTRQTKLVRGMQDHADKSAKHLFNIFKGSETMGELAAVLAPGPDGVPFPWLASELREVAQLAVVMNRPRQQSLHFASIACGVGGTMLGDLAPPFGHLLTPNAPRMAQVCGEAHVRAARRDAHSLEDSQSEEAAAELVGRGFMSPDRLPLYLRLLEGPPRGDVLADAGAPSPFALGADPLGRPRADAMQTELFFHRLVQFGSHVSVDILEQIGESLQAWKIATPIISRMNVQKDFNRGNALTKAEITLAAVQELRAQIRGKAYEDMQNGVDPLEGQDEAPPVLQRVAARIRAQAHKAVLYAMIVYERMDPEIVYQAAWAMGIDPRDIGEGLTRWSYGYAPPVSVLAQAIRTWNKDEMPLEEIQRGYVPVDPIAIQQAAQETSIAGVEIAWASMAQSPRDLVAFARRTNAARRQIQADVVATRLKTIEGREPTLFGRPVQVAEESVQESLESTRSLFEAAKPHRSGGFGPSADDDKAEIEAKIANPAMQLQATENQFAGPTIGALIYQAAAVDRGEERIAATKEEIRAELHAAQAEFVNEAIAMDTAAGEGSGAEIVDPKRVPKKVHNILDETIPENAASTAHDKRGTGFRRMTHEDFASIKTIDQLIRSGRAMDYESLVPRSGAGGGSESGSKSIKHEEAISAAKDAEDIGATRFAKLIRELYSLPPTSKDHVPIVPAFTVGAGGKDATLSKARYLQARLDAMSAVAAMKRASHSFLFSCKQDPVFANKDDALGGERPPASARFARRNYPLFGLALQDLDARPGGGHPAMELTKPFTPKKALGIVET